MPECISGETNLGKHIWGNSTSNALCRSGALCLFRGFSWPRCDDVMMCPRPQVLRQPHRTPLHACPNLRRITQRSRTNSFAVPRKHRRQRLHRPRPVRLRPIDGPHASSKHTSVRKAFTEMPLRQKRQVDGPSFRTIPGTFWNGALSSPRCRIASARGQQLAATCEAEAVRDERPVSRWRENDY
jgi:hypothetical protein